LADVKKSLGLLSGRGKAMFGTGCCCCCAKAAIGWKSEREITPGVIVVVELIEDELSFLLAWFPLVRDVGDAGDGDLDGGIGDERADSKVSNIEEEGV
jgi:hypothetical protein